VRQSRTANRRICAVGGEPIIAYMTDELKTLRSVLDLCSHGFLIADKLNSLRGGVEGVFVPLLFLRIWVTAEKCWRAGLANIFLFQPAGRRLETGINPFE